MERDGRKGLRFSGMNKGAIIIGVVIALKQRFEELKEGEIDEAAKY